MEEVGLHGKGPDIWPSRVNMQRQRDARGQESPVSVELDLVEFCVLNYKAFYGRKMDKERRMRF